MRHSTVSYEQFWPLSKTAKADRIWEALFLENSPYSEACRGVLTTLHELGLDLSNRDLDSYRNWYGSLSPNDAIELIFTTAGVQEVVMTNDPFDDQERSVWFSERRHDVLKNPRFRAALRGEVARKS